MNKQEIVNNIFVAVAGSDYEYLELIAEIVIMSDEAKHVLRKKGYGYTGVDLLKTAHLVPQLPHYPDSSEAE